MPVAWLAGLRRLPQAYFHTVHDAVARDPYAARMHMLAAGGLVWLISFGLAQIRRRRAA